MQDMCGSAEVEEKTDNKLTMGDAYIARSLPDLLNDCHRFPPFFVDFLARGTSTVAGTGGRVSLTSPLPPMHA